MSAHPVDTYYPTMEHLLDYYDHNARQYGYDANNLKEDAAWKTELRGVLLEITGLGRLLAADRPELGPRLLETVRMDGYTRQKLLVETEDKVFMPFYMLVPEGAEVGGKRPCVIAPHGHGCGPYPVAGLREYPGCERQPYDPKQAYGERLVREGYVVFCPTARGIGERREFMHQGDAPGLAAVSSCTLLNYSALCLGLTVTGMWVYDLMRLIDYIGTLPFCDAARIACVGFSGGGLQSLWLGVLEPRVKCAVVSGYFHGYKDTILRTNRCGCNYVPHLYETCDIGDLGALVAPRALLIESGDKDPLNGHRGLTDVAGQVAVTRRAYRLHHAEERLLHHVFAGVHEYNGDQTAAFLQKWL